MIDYASKEYVKRMDKVYAELVDNYLTYTERICQRTGVKYRDDVSIRTNKEIYDVGRFSAKEEEIDNEIKTFIFIQLTNSSGYTADWKIDINDFRDIFDKKLT